MNRAPPLPLQAGSEFFDHLDRTIGFLGLAESLQAHVLFPVDVGHIRPGMRHKRLIDGRISPAYLRVRLFYMDNRRIAVELFL